MKLKKVAALCSANKAFFLFDENREGGEIRQWLGDGYSMYLLSGLPLLDENNVCAMFDIPEKKRKKYRSKRQPTSEVYSLEDWEQGERALNDEWPTVEYDGRTVKPLSTIDDMTFIQEKYLLPLDGLEYMRLYERQSTSGGLYIVAKIGMILQAVIMPMDLPDKDFMEALNGLTSQCRDAMRKKALIPKQESVPERETGPLFQVDKSTGEVVGEGAGE